MEPIINYKEKVDTKLIIRQWIFLVIIIVLFVINIVNLFEGKVGILLAVSGFLAATIFGTFLSRMFKIFWHEEKGKVVSRLDAGGAILLVLYILVEIGRNWFFGYWLSGAALTAFSLIIFTGLIAGRFLGTFFKIKKVLSADNSGNSVL